MEYLLNEVEEILANEAWREVHEPMSGMPWEEYWEEQREEEAEREELAAEVRRSHAHDRFHEQARSPDDAARGVRRRQRVDDYVERID